MLIVQSKPVLYGGGLGEADYGWGGFGGGYGGGCGPAIPPSPPISFVPVPQPLPVKIPAPPNCQKQSVTIPNIILALLPPNSKPPCAPKPVLRPPPPQPIVVPLPQPCPVPVPTPCGC